MPQRCRTYWRHCRQAAARHKPKRYGRARSEIEARTVSIMPFREKDEAKRDSETCFNGRQQRSLGTMPEAGVGTAPSPKWAQGAVAATRPFRRSTQNSRGQKPPGPPINPRFPTPNR